MFFEVVIVYMKYISDIVKIKDLVERKLAFMSALTNEAEKIGLKPIVVGGTAVEFYRVRVYTSMDIDLLSNRKSIGYLLEDIFGFKNCGRIWVSELMGFSVEVPQPEDELAGDKNRIKTIKVEYGMSKPIGVIYIIGIEDLIIDRLLGFVAYKNEPNRNQVIQLLFLYKDKIDIEYLFKKASESNCFSELKDIVDCFPELKDIFKI